MSCVKCSISLFFLFKTTQQSMNGGVGGGEAQQKGRSVTKENKALLQEKFVTAGRMGHIIFGIRMIICWEPRRCLSLSNSLEYCSPVFVLYFPFL